MARIKNESLIDVETIGDKIIHISMDNKNALASAMMRFQEYYESPFEDIRGKIFTVGYLKSKGSRAKPGVNSYCGNVLMEAEWDGYNIPSSVLEPFIKGLFDPLTVEEAAIVEMFRYRTDDFYLIATYGDQGVIETLEHEIRHAMWGISKEYKAEVTLALQLHRSRLKPLRKCLVEWGYHPDVLDDECHAYMGADHDYFFNNFTEDVEKHGVVKLPALRDKLNKIAAKYKKKLDIPS